RLRHMPFRIAVGLDESQTVNFTINSLKPLKDQKLSLTTSGKLANHLTFFQENSYRLDPLQSLTLNKGTSKNIWIILKSNGLSAGKYHQNLHFKIGDHQVDIPIDVHVYPVHLPEKNYLP